MKGGNSMTDLDMINKPEDLPTNREFYLELNERLESVGLPKLIITNDCVYKDELHQCLGIGIRLEA